MLAFDGCEFAYPPTVIFRARPTWHYGREPVLRRLPDGSLTCLIYSGGPKEPDDENLVLVTRSHDDGATWSAPTVLFQHHARATWATELFTAGDRPCAFVHTFDAASHYLELKTWRSFWDAATDTWSEPASLPGGVGNCVVRQGEVLADGTWLFPVYWQDAPAHWDWAKQSGAYQHHPGWLFRCGVLRSTDQGQSFSLHGNVANHLALWEPNVVETAPGRLVMLLRAEGAPHKFRSDSHDGGLTWSPPEPTEIPCANSKVTLVRWRDAVLMLHNPSPRTGWQERRSLELWISRDGCATWPTRLPLVRALTPGKVVCYPHAFVDEAQQRLYVACDTAQEHYLFTVPLADLR